MIEALQYIAQETATGDDNEAGRINVDVFKQIMTSAGKETGQNLLDHEIEDIIFASNLLHAESLVVEDFAKYLMSK